MSITHPEYTQIIKSYEHQLDEINLKLNELATKKQYSNIKDNRYDCIKKFKLLKQAVIDQILRLKNNAYEVNVITPA